MARKKKEVAPLQLVENTKVNFYGEDGHDYMRDDDFTFLTGVTSILHKYVFPDMYDGVSEKTLKKAAEKGTRIHNTIEKLDKGMEVEDITDILPQVTNYKQICKDNDLHHEASEYLISDNDFVASSIDKVYRTGDNTFMLADIKTTYKLNEDYVRWQLSIYKYLFELQNPEAKVKGLYAIWLRDEKSKFVELEPIDKKIVIGLLDAAKNDTEWTNPLAMVDLAMSDEDMEEEDELLIKLEQLKECETYKKSWVEKYRSMFEEQGENVRAFVGKQVTIARTQPGIKTVFDEARFAEENPELYKQYLMVKTTPSTIRININK